MSKSINADTPQLIESTNLSWAWAEIIQKLNGKRGHTLSPLIVSIRGFDEQGNVHEDAIIRQELELFPLDGGQAL